MSGVLGLPAPDVLRYKSPKVNGLEYFESHLSKRDELYATNTCTSHGSFETGKSNSWIKYNETFEVFKSMSHAVAGSDAIEIYHVGTYGADSVQMNEEKIDNATFLVFNETISTGGWLGLASNMNERLNLYFIK
jgi:hypothetical protein